jgi:hypothetical protein
MGKKGFTMPSNRTRVEYEMDGQTVRLQAVYDRIYSGQRLVLFHVGFGTPEPLARYEQPAVFTAVAVDVDNKTVELRDANERLITTKISNLAYLYDLEEWAMFQYRCLGELLRRKDRKIEQLTGHLDLLKAILTNQGFRVVTAEQAAAIGLQ